MTQGRHILFLTLPLLLAGAGIAGEGFRFDEVTALAGRVEACDPDAARTYVDLAGAFPGLAAFALEQPWRGGNVARAEVDLWCPADLPAGSEFTFFAQDKDGIWFQAEAREGPTRGGMSTLAFDVSWRSGAMTPVGHGAMWNRYYAGRMARAGLQLACPADWNGAVRVMALRLLEAEPPPDDAPLRVLRPSWPTDAEAYTPTELAFELDPPAANPCDPDEIALAWLVTAPSGRTFRLACFYDQPHERWLNNEGVERTRPVGRARWKARFTPLEAGEHRWRLARERGWDTDAPTFEPLTTERALLVRDAPPRGFVRVSERDPRYLETADGAAFHPIGLNLHSPFCKVGARLLQMDLPPDRGTFLYDDYFPLMRAAGMNTAEVWMANWWVSLEWSAAWPGFRGLADYNLANAWRLDRVFDAAREQGIHILLNLDNHGKYSPGVDMEWASSPYAAANGGPCATPEDFFTNEDAFRLHRKRTRYLAARWGAQPNLMAVSLVSEINLTGGNRAAFKWHPAKPAWAARAAAAWRAHGPYGNPVGVQYTGNWPQIDPAMAAQPGVDFIGGNAYATGEITVPLYLETTEKTLPFGKPYLTVEYGKHLSAAETREHMRADLHAGLWATAMTAAAGSPLLWWHDYVYQYDLWSDWAALARFMEGTDRRGSPWHTSTPPVRRPDGTAAGPGRDMYDAMFAPPDAPRQAPPARIASLKTPSVAAAALTNGLEGAFWLYDETYSVTWPFPSERKLPGSTWAKLTASPEAAARTEAAPTCDDDDFPSPSIHGFNAAKETLPPEGGDKEGGFQEISIAGAKTKGGYLPSFGADETRSNEDISPGDATDDYAGLHRHEGVTAFLPGYLPGRYRVEYWDTLAGEVVATEEVTADFRGLPVAPPAFWLDVAGKTAPLDPPADPLDHLLHRHTPAVFAPLDGGTAP